MTVIFTKKRVMNFLRIVAVLVVIMSTEAQAVLYPFAAITDNSGVSGWMAQQLSLEVTPYGTSQVLFTFYNAVGPYDGIIGTVFFEDGALFALDADSIIENPPAVDFEAGTHPPSRQFPAGELLEPDFVTTQYFWASTSNSVQTGVNPGESLGIVFDLESGKNFADVLTAIGLGFTNPNPGVNTSLRIGVHVQNLPPGTAQSDSFILTPIPASVVLGILGLSVAGLKLRRFV